MFQSKIYTSNLKKWGEKDVDHGADMSGEDLPDVRGPKGDVEAERPNALKTYPFLCSDIWKEQQVGLGDCQKKYKKYVAQEKVTHLYYWIYL